jgi:UDP-2,3-diacylglucosamine pyrophosphatase LpxH
MRFLKSKRKFKKVVLVISDIHLGAGVYIEGKRNLLEDFHYDQELVDFLNFYSTGDYQNMDVELVINGDFLDLLAVPNVNFFDDEYWSEAASLEKLRIICNAHPEVLLALDNFVSHKNKKIVYIIGNHDAEMVFDSLKNYFLALFKQENRERILIDNENHTYCPVEGVYIQHGHEYELAHHYDPKNTVLELEDNRRYFIPSWGSYYVTHIINKYKQEREYANSVRPIKNFLIHGLVFDTFFTLRFMIANAYYFIMVRFLHYYRLKQGWGKIISDSLSELSLFQKYENLTRAFFQEHDDCKALIVGHTHEPIYREYGDGTVFINTGTWTKMTNLDLKFNSVEANLAFAKIEVIDSESHSSDNIITLNKWLGKRDFPFEEFI